jgi:NDP-sugar pyrophosphorylase family protein
MISIILAAGQGTRMRPLSYYIPKILLPVRGRPVLDYLIENMENVEVKHHYIVVSEHVEAIETYLDKTGKTNMSIIRALGWETGGDLSIAFEEVGDKEDAIVMNGDIITDVDMGELSNFHMEHNSTVSMALLELTDDQEAKRFGQIVLADDSSVTEFSEKNQSGRRKSNLVNVGFYIFNKNFISHRNEYMTPRKFKIEHELFPKLAQEHKLFGMKMNIDYWWDVGTTSTYLKAEHFFINSKSIIPP